MKKVKAIVLVLVMLVASIPNVWASEIDDLQAQINELKNMYQTKIEALEEKVAELTVKQGIVSNEEKEEKPSIGLDYVGRYEGAFKKGGLMLDNPSGFGSVSLGGYADFEYKDFDNANSTFDQHRFVINIGAEIGDRLRFYSEYEIEHGGPNSANGDGESKVEQAYIDYLVNDAFNLRFGALLVPFGRYNLYHDSDLQDLTDRPLVARRVIPTTWTESGMGFFGEFNPAPNKFEDLSLGYELYVVNGLDNGYSDRGLRSAKGSIKSDNNNNKAVVARTLLSPATGHEFGFSAYTGKLDDGNANSASDKINGYAFDFLSTFGDLEFLGEFARFEIDSENDVPETMRGAYVQTNYHFWPEFLNNTFLGENFEDPTLTFAARYGWAKIADDADALSGDNEEDRITLGLNYRPVPSWVFKLEYQWNNKDNETLERGDSDGFVFSVAMGF